MRKLLALAAGVAMMGAVSAHAEPLTLTSGQMDQVTAAGFPGFDINYGVARSASINPHTYSLNFVTGATQQIKQDDVAAGLDAAQRRTGYSKARQFSASLVWSTQLFPTLYTD